MSLQSGFSPGYETIASQWTWMCILEDCQETVIMDQNHSRSNGRFVRKRHDGDTEILTINWSLSSAERYMQVLSLLHFDRDLQFSNLTEE